ncbi:hypothetical protein [Streptomyces sp. NPDC101237]|uniref:hypothetical protein n=1 Tax=Streptomyces sp. NPDC101237 TaxID=3366139 RepID=UPI003804A9EE
MTHEPEQENRRHSDGTEPPVPPMPDRGRKGPARGMWRRQPARVRAVTVALLAGALALGGTAAFAAGSGQDGSGSPSGSATPSACPSPDGRGHGHGWFGRGGLGVHGEATVKDPDTGKYVVRVWQRGTVDKTNGDHVTVKSDDGTSWTWTVGSDVTVRGDSGSLKKDAKAFLVGTRADDGKLTAAAAFSGDFKGMGRGGGHDHGGPWHHHGDRSPSPSPSGSGATT